ncbi:hypothetical protein DPMN_185095 [Dreissena polymorpha]|uniref:Uncharacterized protein n=1 Tax=Dreissena polymorpha TaxID=45954 RepID=A0A9D4DKA7_DREPO|nr:hypothetical protein DPMN_185095 [Dreissena polymorpha]
MKGFFINRETILLCISGQTESTDMCWGGYYCQAGSSVPNPSAFICPLGLHCPNGSSTGLVSYEQFQMIVISTLRRKIPINKKNRVRLW